MGLGEPDTDIRVTAIKDSRQIASINDTREAECFGCGAVPLSGFFTMAEVVVLDTGCDTVEVILLLTDTQFRDTQHDGPAGIAWTASGFLSGFSNLTQNLTQRVAKRPRINDA